MLTWITWRKIKFFHVWPINNCFKMQIEIWTDSNNGDKNFKFPVSQKLALWLRDIHVIFSGSEHKTGRLKVAMYCKDGVVFFTFLSGCWCELQSKLVNNNNYLYRFAFSAFTNRCSAALSSSSSLLSSLSSSLSSSQSDVALGTSDVEAVTEALIKAVDYNMNRKYCKWHFVTMLSLLRLHSVTY